MFDMYETNDIILQMTGIYLAVGFALGIIYNIFRFFRYLLPDVRLISVISDFIFAIISGIVLFIFSAAYGRGYFRLYYLLSAAIGFTGNMLTLGFLIPPSAKVLRRLFLRFNVFISAYFVKIISFIRQKMTAVFIKIGEKITKIVKNFKIYLKKLYTKVYNKSDHKIGELYQESGETGNAIKAKVRKVG